MLLAEDQDAVGEFGPGGEDESFGEAVRARAARRDLHVVDPCAGHDGVECGGELSGAVADEEPEGVTAVVEIHQQVAGLLGGPRAGRMAGRSEDVHVAVVDFQREEHVDPLQGERAVDVEEVHGQHSRGLGAEESSAGGVGRSQRCRRYAPMFEDPANRGGADPVAELEQFALHALISPGRILSGQPFDQAAMVGVDARAAVGVRVGPFLGYQVNADGLRLISGRAGWDLGRGSAVGAGRRGCRRGGSVAGFGRASR
jgi:hypothetical protein